MLALVEALIVQASPCGNTTIFSDDFGSEANLANIASFREWDPRYNGFGPFCPESWGCTTPGNSTRLGLSGNIPWGGVETPFGNPYAILQGNSASLVRIIPGLVPATSYILSFFVAQRKSRQAQAAERISVSIDGSVVAGEIDPTIRFTPMSFTFVAKSSEVTVLFENTSPVGDLSVFVTSVKVSTLRSCGEGATCKTPVPPATGYQCRCDGELGYIGASVNNAPAKCNAHGALVDVVSGVQSRVDALEKSSRLLSSTTGGLSEASETAADDIITLKSDVAAIKDQLDALLAALAATPSVTTPVLMQPQPQPDFKPELVADGNGGLDIVVQPKRRMTVNGEYLLVSSDVSALVNSAVASALASVADSASVTPP